MIVPLPQIKETIPVSNSLFNIWIDDATLVVATYAIILIVYWILIKKSISRKQQGYDSHYIQDFYMIIPDLRGAEMNNSLFPPPMKVIRFWAYRLIIIIFLVYIRILFVNLEISFLRDFATIFIGLYFCRGASSIFVILKNIFLFTEIKNNPKDISGKIKLSRTFLYRRSKDRLTISAILWLFIFLLVGHIFFLGGVLDMFILGFSISRWERKDSLLLNGEDN